MRRHIAASLLLAAIASHALAAAATEVDLEPVLLADASRSIDAAEIRFQRQGHANALVHPEVQAAIATGFLQTIAVTYVESGNA